MEVSEVIFIEDFVILFIKDKHLINNIKNNWDIVFHGYPCLIEIHSIVFDKENKTITSSFLSH